MPPNRKSKNSKNWVSESIPSNCVDLLPLISCHLIFVLIRDQRRLVLFWQHVAELSECSVAKVSDDAQRSFGQVALGFQPLPIQAESSQILSQAIGVVGDLLRLA